MNVLNEISQLQAGAYTFNSADTVTSYILYIGKSSAAGEPTGPTIDRFFSFPFISSEGALELVCML